MEIWILLELENDIFWDLCFCVSCISKKKILFRWKMKISLPFIWGSIYFCTRDGFFRILKKTSFKLLCTQHMTVTRENANKWMETNFTFQLIVIISKKYASSLGILFFNFVFVTEVDKVTYQCPVLYTVGQ